MGGGRDFRVDEEYGFETSLDLNLEKSGYSGDQLAIADRISKI